LPPAIAFHVRRRVCSAVRSSSRGSSPEHRELGNWNRVTHASILVKTADGRVVRKVPLNPLLK
jgi:hypothetical protein